MGEDKKEKIKIQFKKVYLDTVKHIKDIERWIEINNRNPGDIRRSLQRLKEKYNTLYLICDKAKEIGIREKELIPSNGYSLNKIEGKIRQLFETAKIDMQQMEKNNTKKYNATNGKTWLPHDTELIIGETIYTPRMMEKEVNNTKSESTTKLDPDTAVIIESNAYNQSYYTERNSNENQIIPTEKLEPNIEVVEEIAGTGFYKEKRKIIRTKKEHKKRERFNIKNAVLSKFYYLKHKFQDRKMLINYNKKIGRIAAAFMAGVIGFFGGITVGQSVSKNQDISNEGVTNSYIDTNNNEFKKSLYIEVLDEKSEVQEDTKKDTINNGKKYQIDPPPYSQGITRFTQR